MLTQEAVKSLEPGTTLEYKKGEGPSLIHAIVRVISIRDKGSTIQVFARIVRTLAHGGHVDIHATNTTMIDPQYLSHYKEVGEK